MAEQEIKPDQGSDKDKSGQVRDMFDAIAPRYDMLNHLLSVGIDYIWRRHLVKMVVRENSPHNLRILDVATGTGDLALALKRAIPAARITGIDLSEKMVDVARAKVCRAEVEIELLVGDAQELSFAVGSFDVVTAAFGVRNFEDLERGLRAMYDVLAVGGRVYILEFSNPSASVTSMLYKLYFNKILPRVGGVISGDSKAYHYLPRSVESFLCGTDFTRAMEEAGFVHCGHRAFTGEIATLYYGIKL